MSHLEASAYHEIPTLFSNNMLRSPLLIRAFIGEIHVDGMLSHNGAVEINGILYPNIHGAMRAVNHLKESTSTPWQFWCWYSEERQAWTPLEHVRAKLASSETHNVKTSLSHPLRIDTVRAPLHPGRIGLTFCPGKCTEGLYGGTWQRDLPVDIEAIKSWGASTLISLMENHEFSLLGVPTFSTVVQNIQNLQWLHLPIQDMQIPNANFEKHWQSVGPRLHQQLQQEESIVIHCRGGLGRTGLLAARLLVETGVLPIDAVAMVRNARERSIETYSQEHYVLTKMWEQT